MNDSEKAKYKFIVDGKEFETEISTINGQECRVLANIPGNYQLFLEEEGDKPDQSISDGISIDLSGTIKCLYAVPPAAFGRQ